MVAEVAVGSAVFGRSSLVLIAGPDVIEDENMIIATASQIRQLCDKHQISFVFKSSYRKDNRSSIHGYAGPGLEQGLAVLASVRQDVGVPVTSDVHSVSDIELAASVLDLIQIPAFLCKQTSLLLAAAETHKPINIKKGQFVDPYSMRHTLEKVESVGNKQIILTERGTTFGYHDLVNDFRALPIMRSFGYPVVFDAGHSVRLTGVPSESPKGAHREFIPALTRAAMAAGCDGLFIEVHPNPDLAKCDGSSQLPMDELESLLVQAQTVFQAAALFSRLDPAPRPSIYDELYR